MKLIKIKKMKLMIMRLIMVKKEEKFVKKKMPKKEKIIQIILEKK